MEMNLHNLAVGARQKGLHVLGSGDILHSQADISRARDLLGFEPFTTLEQGVSETLDWFRGVFASGGRSS